jgi:hypothetical protein
MLLVALALAVPASATIVFEHSNEIWAVNDDGSSPRMLAAPGPLGMDSGLGHPHVAPNGTTVVFDGTTNRNYHTCSGTIHYGLGATGVYTWNAGQVARVTPQPIYYECGTDFENEPEATTNGRVDYGFFACNGYVSGQIGSFSCLHQIWSEDLSGDNFQELPSCAGAESPSPNPADPNEYAAVGCTLNNNYVVSRSVGDDHTAMSFDDAPQKDVSWRADGQRVVQVEGGGDPGIWDSARDTASNSFTYILAQPDGVEFQSPRYMGANQDKILFSASGDLWTVPASCGSSGAPCQFPTDATQLTGSGGNSDPAWSAQPIAVPSTGGGGDGPGGDGPGGDGPGGDGPGGTDPLFSSAPQLGGKATPASGVTLLLTLARESDLRFTFYRVTGGGKGKLLVGARAKKFGSASRRGKAGQNRFKFRKVGGKKFKRGKYLVRVRGDGASTQKSFRVKR